MTLCGLLNAWATPVGVVIESPGPKSRVCAPTVKRSVPSST